MFEPAPQIVITLTFTAICAVSYVCALDFESGLGEAPIVTLGVPANTTDATGAVPTAEFSWAAPMAVRRIAATTPPTVMIGTDDDHCSDRDAVKRNVAASPVAGFVQFAFDLSAALRFTWLQFELDSYGPDSLSDSFWLQIDNQTADETKEVSIPSGSGNVVTHTIVFGSDNATFEDRCVRVAPNVTSSTPERHTVRLYARQAGAAVARFRVYRMPSIEVRSVTGCSPACGRRDVNTIQMRVSNLCGPAQLQMLRVTVNGVRCTRLLQLAVDRIQCALAPDALAGVPDEDTTANLSIVFTDTSSGAAMPVQYARVNVLTVEPTGLRGTQLHVLIAAISVVFVLLLLCLGVCLRGRRGARDTAHAPREAPMAFLFTDIEDSTALWGAYTRSMAAALDTHHAVIRAAIAAHKGYEVKTIGDAFMIACKSPGQAFAIAAEVQRELHRQAWPRCITGHYLGAADADDEPGDVAGAGPADAFVGVRVRIGIHVGAADATFDEVTQGFDYYGPAVNATARTESAARGGQILATREAVKCLEPGSGLSVAAEGVAELKGIGPTALCELAVDGLPSRRQYGVPTVGGEHSSAHGLDSASHDASNSESDGGAPVRVEAFTMEALRTRLFREAAARMVHGGLPAAALQALALHGTNSTSGQTPGTHPTPKSVASAFANALPRLPSVCDVGDAIIPLPPPSKAIGVARSPPIAGDHNSSFSPTTLLAATQPETPTVDASATTAAIAVDIAAHAVRSRVLSCLSLLKPLSAAKQEEMLLAMVGGWRAKSVRLPRAFAGAVAALPPSQQAAVRVLRTAVACVERSLPAELSATRSVAGGKPLKTVDAFAVELAVAARKPSTTPSVVRATPTDTLPGGVLGIDDTRQPHRAQRSSSLVLTTPTASFVSRD